MGRAVIVTGTPGTGKTVFARSLAKSLGLPYLSLPDYAAKRRLFSGYDKKRESKVIDITRVRNSLKADLARQSGLTVIDTNVPDGIVPKSKAKVVVVLRCHPKVLEQRLRKRKWSRDKVYENVLAEILDSILVSATAHYGSSRVVQVDMTKRALRSCVQDVERALKEKRVPKVKVDWIKRLNREGLLSRYLA